MSAFKKTTARVADGATCGLMRYFQWRLRREVSEVSQLQRYVGQHAGMKLEDYHAEPPEPPVSPPPDQAGLQTWASPCPGPFEENNQVRVRFFPSRKGWEAPTVLFLHALMSASVRGYVGWAQKFNALGWNACFIELPFHYGKTPRGYLNGELAISSDLVRTAEAIRQGVAEVRQVLKLLRRHGGHRFGLWATSYGGWIGGVTAALEADWEFLLFITPVVDVDHAIWESTASVELRRQLHRAGIERSMTRPMMSLTSPSRMRPRIEGERILVGGGHYDQMVDPAHLTSLESSWPGTKTYFLPQGHFGYGLMREGFRLVQTRHL